MDELTLSCVENFMSINDSLLFIDTNKYLDLYRIYKGKELLVPLKEQADHIFVTQQVVNEVQRNKIVVAAEFLKEKFQKLKLQTFNLPDHLSSTYTNQRQDILDQMSKIIKDVEKVNTQVDAWELSILKQINCSEDEVSKALSSIFANPVSHTSEELQRARERKELGNPPGKGAGSIGDQLNWEQILTNFKGKKRLWIISRDSDYGIIHDGQGFLNRFLYEELCKIVPTPEVYLFGDLATGIKHFVNTTGVKAEQGLSPEVAEEIEREEKSLPPLPLSKDFFDTVRDIQRQFKQSNQNSLESLNQQLSQVNYRNSLRTDVERVLKMIDKS
jgi:hypothetical protein